MSQSSPVSEDTDSLGEFVDDDALRRGFKSQIPYPPTAQFSPTTGDFSKITHNAVERTRGNSTHRSNSNFRHERERVHSNTPRPTLLRLLITEEYEAKETRKLLHSTLSQLKSSSQRVTEAEAQRRALESSQVVQGMQITQTVIVAQQEASRAVQEAGLYKAQLDKAQREILRAREIVQAVEMQRDDAERAAAKARTMARRLNEEKVLFLAREEGRKEGFEEGMKMGRLAPVTRDESRMLEYNQPRHIEGNSASRVPAGRGMYVGQRGGEVDYRGRAESLDSSQSPPSPRRRHMSRHDRHDNGRQYTTPRQMRGLSPPASMSSQSNDRTRAIHPPGRRTTSNQSPDRTRAINPPGGRVTSNQSRNRTQDINPSGGRATSNQSHDQTWDINPPGGRATSNQSHDRTWDINPPGGRATSNQSHNQTQAVNPPRGRSTTDTHVSGRAPSSSASVSVHNPSQPAGTHSNPAQISRRSQGIPRPPDGFIPVARSDGSDSFFAMPPPHELEPPSLFVPRRAARPGEPVPEREHESESPTPRPRNMPQAPRGPIRLERQATNLESELTAPPPMPISSIVPAAIPTLPYLPMPAPPTIPVIVPMPVQPPAPAPMLQQQPQSQAQPQVPTHPRRRSSPEPHSASSSTTGISQLLDLVTFPASSVGATRGSNGRGDREHDRELERERIRELSIIQEDDISARSHSPTVPRWTVQPPVVTSQGVPGRNERDIGGPGQTDLGSQFMDRQHVEEWRRAASDETRSDPDRSRSVLTPLSPDSTNFLTPTFQPQSQMRAGASRESLTRASSGSSLSVPGITIEPPSRPPSIGHGPVDDDGSGFLSPNHAHMHIPLAPTNHDQSPVIPVIPNTPSYAMPIPSERQVPSGTDDYLPPGFIPQTIPSPLQRANMNLGESSSNDNGRRSPQPRVIPWPPDQPGTDWSRNETFVQNPASPPRQGQPTFVFPPPSPRQHNVGFDPLALPIPSGVPFPPPNLPSGAGGAGVYQRPSHLQSSNGPQSFIGDGVPNPMTPRQTYAAAPTPPGLYYPVPLAAATPGRAAERTPLSPSLTGSSRSARSQTPYSSKNLHAGTTPASIHSSLPGPSFTSNGPVRKSSLRKTPPSAIQVPLANFYPGIDNSTHFPNSSNESLLDPTTALNTFANSSSATALRMPVGLHSPVRPFAPFP